MRWDRAAGLIEIIAEKSRRSLIEAAVAARVAQVDGDAWKQWIEDMER